MFVYAFSQECLIASAVVGSGGLSGMAVQRVWRFARFRPAVTCALICSRESFYPKIRLALAVNAQDVGSSGPAV